MYDISASCPNISHMKMCFFCKNKASNSRTSLLAAWPKSHYKMHFFHKNKTSKHMTSLLAGWSQICRKMPFFCKNKVHIKMCFVKIKLVNVQHLCRPSNQKVIQKCVSFMKIKLVNVWHLRWLPDQKVIWKCVSFTKVMLVILRHLCQPPKQEVIGKYVSFAKQANKCRTSVLAAQPKSHRKIFSFVKIKQVKVGYLYQLPNEKFIQNDSHSWN